MIARFVGGPLHDTTLDKPRRGRWTIYRDNDGEPLRAALGDREFCSPGGNLTRYYTHQLCAGGQHLYIHATAWNAWNASGQPTEPGWSP